MLKVAILDGYIDEPTCLGVPPYISPYPRYIAGAIWNFDKKAQISYITIDQIRNDNSFQSILSNSDIVVVIAGMVVPGRYLAGFPASPYELMRILNGIEKPLKILGGPAARFGFGLEGGKQIQELNTVEEIFDLIIPGDIETALTDLLNNNLKIDKIDPNQTRKNATSIRDYAINGAKMIEQHPNFPKYLICEIETYRGCSRSITGGCTFCSEPSKGSPDFREQKEIIDEIQALYNVGCKHFRLGNQPCIFSYKAHNAESEEFPRPNPDAIEQLFSGIRKNTPDLKTLHIDNANPGIIARYPDESKKITKTIIKYHTPGDVAAFGVESVDPNVIKQNNLKATAEEVKTAIKLINDIGSKRGSNGMPELLPGLNFVFGLIGETKQTFDLNYQFLNEIYDEGYQIRRINLRQALSLPGTKLYDTTRKTYRNKAKFKRFKRKVKETIERPMLERILPIGTVLKDVYSEKHDGKVTFGRQIGSYPLLVGIPGVFNLQQFQNVKIVDYGYRSITAVPDPLDINNASIETLMALPGIGKKRAIRIITARPFKDKSQFLQAIDDQKIANEVQNYLTFKELKNNAE